MDDETPSVAALTMDRGIPLGNQLDTFGRRALDVIIGNSPGQPIPITVSALSAKTATIANLTVTLANTEVSYVIPDKTSKMTIRSRLATRIQFAFIATQSSTNYFTIIPGGIWSEDELDLTATTLYLQTDKPGQIIEILTWQHS